jgi:hypothetical protein
MGVRPIDSASRRRTLSFETLVVLGAIVVATALALGSAPPAAATVTGTNPCPAIASYPWMGNSVGTRVTIPSQSHPNGITSYKGAILRPADTSAYPGKRPLVAIQHGLGGTLCTDWWLAEDLAGHGYTAIAWTSPKDPNHAKAFANAYDASRSAILFAGTSSNPDRARTDVAKVTMAGHSMGSIVTSAIQSDPALHIKAGIALDSLRRYIVGDPAAAASDCVGDPAGQVTPVAPVLGFAMDLPCAARPDFASPDLKLDGFDFWHANRVPATSLVMAGFTHGDFASGGSEQQQRILDHYIRAWLALYIKGDQSATQRMLARSVDGMAAETLFSSRFLSGLYLPGRFYSRDYRVWLETH